MFLVVRVRRRRFSMLRPHDSGGFIMYSVHSVFDSRHLGSGEVGIIHMLINHSLKITHDIESKRIDCIRSDSRSTHAACRPGRSVTLPAVEFLNPLSRFQMRVKGVVKLIAS